MTDLQNYSSQRLFRQEPVVFGESDSWTFSKIIDELTPLVEEERFQRLQSVIEKRSLSVAPVLEDIYDRGNVSAVMRSAEAFGFIDFHIIEKPEARFKNSNRVSKGTERWMDLQKHESTFNCVQLLRKRGYKIYCTHLGATKTIDEIDFNSHPVAVVLGNEKDGVSEEMVSLADDSFILPMAGFAQSFNISVAGALVFYHIYQKRQSLRPHGELTDKEKQMLLANYMYRSVGAAQKVLTRKSHE
ncbi:MAG: RNA methyltransferase [Bdellovibrionales bacterium]|nr:RNA methyltransferase [Bdellovibrionales bacterium]